MSRRRREVGYGDVTPHPDSMKELIVAQLFVRSRPEPHLQRRCAIDFVGRKSRGEGVAEEQFP